MAAGSELRAVVRNMIDAGESEENIAAVIRKMTTTDSSQLENEKPSTMERVASGAKGALKGLAQTAYSGSGAKAMIEGRGVPGIMRDQFDTFVGPQIEEAKKAWNAPTLSEMVGHAGAAVLPVVGPMAAHAGEMIAEDKLPELAGEALIMGAVPVVAKGVAKVAPPVAAVVRSAAQSELLARAAKHSARTTGAAAGAYLGYKTGVPGLETAGAVIGSEAGRMLRDAMRRRSSEPAAIVPEVMDAAAPMPSTRPALPPGPVITPPPVDTSGPLPFDPGMAPENLHGPKPNPNPPTAPAAEVVTPKAEKPKASARSSREPEPVLSASSVKANAAAILQDKMRAKELARVRKELGTKDVQIVRYEPRSDAKGNKTGIADPVYVVPDEFVEQAQIMGLRVRRQTALEKAARVRRAEGKQ